MPSHCGEKSGLALRTAIRAPGKAVVHLQEGLERARQRARKALAVGSGVTESRVVQLDLHAVDDAAVE